VRDYLDVGFRLVTGFIGHLQLVIYCGAMANSHIVQFTAARTESSRFAMSSPVLWYWLPTADVSLPLGSPTVLLPKPQQLLTHSEVIHYIHLAPLHFQ
jgi:hypothetical protein